MARLALAAVIAIGLGTFELAGGMARGLAPWAALFPAALLAASWFAVLLALSRAGDER